MEVWPLPHISFRGVNTIDEKRPTALLTQSDASKSINLPLIIQAEPNRNDKQFVDYLATNLPKPVQVIYAVGDGLVIDVAKAVAAANEKPLVVVPTAIGTDSPFSPTANFNADGKPIEQATGGAEQVIIDLDLIKSAPPERRAAGIVEVLSIMTGLLDWGYAAQKNKTTPETKMTPWALGVAAGLASPALKSAAALGKGDLDALHMLVELLGMMVQLDNLLGHQRASKGIEHIFAEAVKADPSVSHAERVGPGILIASALYNKDCAGMRSAMESVGVRLDRLKIEDIRDTVNKLPDYVKQINAPYSILNDLQPNSNELDQALHKSTLLPAK